MNDTSGTREDLYSLVKLWVALGRLDSSTRAWESMKRVPEATKDETYMREGRKVLNLMVNVAEKH